MKISASFAVPRAAASTPSADRKAPDARGVSLASLRKRHAGRRDTKVVLMDQTNLAGLGNMLSDEVLWRSRTHPAQPANTLDEGEVRCLNSAMTATLRASVRAGHVPRPSQWLASQTVATRSALGVAQCWTALKWLAELAEVRCARCLVRCEMDRKKPKSARRVGTP